MNYKSLIIIVTYNSENFIEKCLHSIIAQDYTDWFLIVADNASKDETVTKIREFRNTYPGLDTGNFKLIALRKNMGFAGAVNHAFFNFIKAKRENTGKQPEFLILLNPDIYIDRGSLKKMVSFYKTVNEKINRGQSRAGRIGAAGGLILDYNRDTIQHYGGKIRDNFVTYHINSGKDYSAIKNEKGKTENGKGSLYREDRIKDVDYVTGAFFVTDFGLFSGLGGFDAGYRPAYFEELDYCLKLKKIKRRVVVNPDSVARHFEGASVKKFSRNFYRFYHKNRIRCAIINMDFLTFLKVFLRAELRWLKKEPAADQFLPLFYAYFINFLFLPCNLIIKLKNHLILNKLELK
jgi:O-antigen biosynthesis protein